MLSKYFLLVLDFITTFIILVQSQGNFESPHDSLSSYRFDPNSIPQNEKILQLFLRLASHTAGNLYFLKQKTLEEQLDNLKENEKIAEASKSDINVKRMIEAILRTSSKLTTDASNPILEITRNINSVDNTIPAVLNANSKTSHFYQTENQVPQNNFQNSGIQSSSEEMNTDSKETLKDFENSGTSIEIQNRLLVENDKNNINSQLGGQNLQNSGPISSRINSDNDTGSSNQSGFSSNIGESLTNQQNSNPNSLGTNQMGQDAGSIFTKMFNPATLANLIPLSMVSNVPVIGSGLSGPINMAQNAFSKFGSFPPQLRALPEIEDETNTLVQENLKENNEISFQNSTAIENNYSSPENISVTEEASSTNQNYTEDTSSKSTPSLDNGNTTNNSNFEELSSIPLTEEHQGVDKIDDKIQDKIQDKTQDVDDEQNKKNNRGGEDSRLKLQRLTSHVMKALQDMQKKVYN